MLATAVTVMSCVAPGCSVKLVGWTERTAVTGCVRSIVQLVGVVIVLRNSRVQVQVVAQVALVREAKLS